MIGTQQEQAQEHECVTPGIRAPPIRYTNQWMEGTMKGSVLALIVLATGAVSAFGETATTDFGSPMNAFSSADPAQMLRTPVSTTGTSAQVISDSRSETRGSNQVDLFASKRTSLAREPLSMKTPPVRGLMWNS